MGREYNFRVDASDLLAEALELAGKKPAPLSFGDYEQELLENEVLREAWDAVPDVGPVAKHGSYEQSILRDKPGTLFFYALVRASSPAVVVETGTSRGATTSRILAALDQNGFGLLYSVDIPASAGKLTMPETVRPDLVGHLIPEKFRARWSLAVGDAKEVLPRLLLAHKADMFVHDSLHTRTHMAFEYAVARALMRPDGVIVSDDILWNSAWWQFVETHSLPSLSLAANPNIGLCVNLFDQYETDIGLGVWTSPASA